MRSSLVAAGMNWIAREALHRSRARSSQDPEQARGGGGDRISSTRSDRVEVRFDRPQRAITPARRR